MTIKYITLMYIDNISDSMFLEIAYMWTMHQAYYVSTNFLCVGKKRFAVTFHTKAKFLQTKNYFNMKLTQGETLLQTSSVDRNKR